MPTAYIAINRKTKAIFAASALGSIHNRNAHPAVTAKESSVLFTITNEQTPRERQRLINTLREFKSQFAAAGVTLDALNKNRAHRTEKGINKEAAARLAQYLYTENTRALLASATALAKYSPNL